MQVVVIGGGIVGTSAALTLAEHGADVTVLERGTIAGEASGLNAGVIGGGGWGDRPDANVALKMGSRERYVDLAERGYDFGLDLSGTLTMIRTPAEWNWARASVDADRLAGHCFELLDTDDLMALEPAADPALLGAIFDPMAARAEPVASTEAFATEAVTVGATVRTGCAVTDLRPTAGGGWELDLEIDRSVQSIGADAVVIAAGPWCARLGSLVDVDIPIVPVRGQMWATAPQPPMFRHAIAGAESFCAWSSETPTDGTPPNLTHRGDARTTRHLYGCQRPNGEIIFGGDRVLADDRAVDDAGIAVNHAHATEVFPDLGALQPTRTWAGLMPFSVDGRPLIGPIPGHEGLFLAGGLASGGFGRGPMTGRLVAELVLGHEPNVDMTPIDTAGRVSPRRV